jgi:hypothetical protein
MSRYALAFAGIGSGSLHQWLAPQSHEQRLSRLRGLPGAWRSPSASFHELGKRHEPLRSHSPAFILSEPFQRGGRYDAYVAAERWLAPWFGRHDEHG